MMKKLAIATAVVFLSAPAALADVATNKYDLYPWEKALDEQRMQRALQQHGQPGFDAFASARADRDIPAAVGIDASERRWFDKHTGVKY
jgi:hypothetical protein